MDVAGKVEVRPFRGLKWSVGKKVLHFHGSGAVGKGQQAEEAKIQGSQQRLEKSAKAEKK